MLQSDQQPDSEILFQSIDQLRLEVIASQAQTGLLASGLSAEKLRTEVPKASIGQLIDGAGYFEEQEKGRGPGMMPDIQSIYEWLAFKKYGLKWDTDDQRWSIAFALASKIGREGTFTHRTGKPTGVLSEILTTQRVSLMANVFARKYKAQIKSDVVDALKQL